MSDKPLIILATEELQFRLTFRGKCTRFSWQRYHVRKCTITSCRIYMTKKPIIKHLRRPRTTVHGVASLTDFGSFSFSGLFHLLLLDINNSSLSSMLWRQVYRPDTKATLHAHRTCSGVYLLEFSGHTLSSVSPFLHFTMLADVGRRS